ncbi:ROK family protein [Streptomyces sp. VNUA116]|uniref:ROK family protein n=1 Tax=Streptomyces sp. VNUA116 TaxID=3062449 RepID=UPI002674FC6D|nr:ROK family protein [Streptomyces sp. VNUA116]WKU48942.1 ROK family protein [Streptomyces sp. VNUA116]
MSVLGVDLGGTKAALRLESSSGAGTGSVDSVFAWPATGGAAADLSALAAAAALDRAPAGDPVTAVGVAVPATLDASGRVRGWPNRPSWRGLDLVRELAGLWPDAEVRLADDGDLAALAEAGAAGCPDLVHLGVGTGIGGGIVLGGALCPGTARGSCEVGHVIVDRAGERCDCGRHGCVQSVASGRAVLRRAARRLGRDVGFDVLREAWRDGEPWALETVGESAAALAAAVVSLCELVRPRLVTIGGGFAAGLPGYVAEVAHRVRQFERPEGPHIHLRPAALGALSSLDGAVLLARGAAPSARCG